MLQNEKNAPKCSKMLQNAQKWSKSSTLIDKTYVCLAA
jgi:hypothetical protein